MTYEPWGPIKINLWSLNVSSSSLLSGGQEQAQPFCCNVKFHTPKEDFALSNVAVYSRSVLLPCALDR